MVHISHFVNGISFREEVVTTASIKDWIPQQSRINFCSWRILTGKLKSSLFSAKMNEWQSSDDEDKTQYNNDSWEM